MPRLAEVAAINLQSIPGDVHLVEALFDAETEQKMVNGFELLAEASIFEAAEDGVDEGAKFVLAGEEGRGRNGEGEGNNPS